MVPRILPGCWGAYPRSARSRTRSRRRVPPLPSWFGCMEQKLHILITLCTSPQRGGIEAPPDSERRARTPRGL